MSEPKEIQPKNEVVRGKKYPEVLVGVKGHYVNDAEYTEPRRTWRSYLWSTLYVPKDEARFLTKLDLTLILASAPGVMCRYLDQVNITNAFNSGMTEDLSLYGKELNYANAIWSSAYAFVNAPLHIAFLEFAWTVFTFATAAVKDVNQLYVFSSFVGLFEAGHFPAVMYVCSSYDKPHELARRNTLIRIFTSVGPLFSGFPMAAVHAGLDGGNGLPGWRWMYTVCGCISLPCAIWTAFAMLQLPSRAKANWIFTEKEVELARDIRRWHTTWHVYLFPLFFGFATQLGQSGGSMAEINIIPLGINFIMIFCTLVNSWVSDSLPGSARWPGILFASSMGIIFRVALAVTPVHPPNIATRWTLYYLTALSGTCAGLTWTWVNETKRHDPEKRGCVSALMNAFAYIFTAWVPIFTFPANLQPYIVTGNYITAGFGAAAAMTVLVIRHFYNQDL
ncbi:major facilitator superfamily transporter [Colletotrichum somersetense]|nr:major facilitator superfamily transporter [Colletotrichum somersetense]